MPSAVGQQSPIRPSALHSKLSEHPFPPLVLVDEIGFDGIDSSPDSLLTTCFDLPGLDSGNGGIVRYWAGTAV